MEKGEFVVDINWCLDDEEIPALVAILNGVVYGEHEENSKEYKLAKSLLAELRPIHLEIIRSRNNGN